MRKSAIIVGLVLAVGATGAFAARDRLPSVTSLRPATGWLTGAGSNVERFQKLEKHLRGFENAMWEMGERYERLQQAVHDENYDLALHHWEKIRVALEYAVEKRPKRKENADALFLETTWAEVNEAFASRDPVKAREGLDTSRTACMVCHEAEGVGYMNSQPIFQSGLTKTSASVMP